MNIPLNSRPGFIIGFPITDQCIELLSRIFCHPQMSLITFDCTSELSSFIANEISLHKNIFHYQEPIVLVDKYKDLGAIFIIHSLSSIVEQSTINSDPLSQ
jgi:hypothetical protein